MYCQAKLFAVQIIFYVIIKRKKKKKNDRRKVIFCKEKKRNDKCRNIHTHTQTHKQCLIYKTKRIGGEKEKDNDDNVQKKYYPLFAGVIYLVVEDLSIDNEEVSINESSYCSPSSLCFSTKKE